MLNEKIQGHIIEQKRPPLIKANNATVPVENSPISIAANPIILNILSVAIADVAGLVKTKSALD